MEYAKDEIFQIKYNTKLNRLEMGKENWTSKLVKKMQISLEKSTKYGKIILF